MSGSFQPFSAPRPNGRFSNTGARAASFLLSRFALPERCTCLRNAGSGAVSACESQRDVARFC